MNGEYPSRTDLRDVIRSRLGPDQTRAFFRDRGVLLLSQRREHLAQEGSSFFLGYTDIARLKELLNHEHNYRRSGRFSVKAQPDMADNLVKCWGMRTPDIATSIEGARDVKMTVSNGEVPRITLNYVRRKLGLNSLLEEEPHMVAFTITERNGFVSVNVSHSDRGEYKAVEQALNAALRIVTEGKDIKAEGLSLEKLSLKERIDLFDQVSSFDYPDWRLIEVRKVSLKKLGTVEEEDDGEGEGAEDLDEQADNDATTEQLRGLTHALLEGSHLRENQFVHDCLDNAFFFSGARIRFQHKRDAKMIDLDINFRSRLGEVNIGQTALLSDDKPEWGPFGRHEQDCILEGFQTTIDDIYRKLVSARIKKAEAVAG